MEDAVEVDVDALRDAYRRGADRRRHGARGGGRRALGRLGVCASAADARRQRCSTTIATHVRAIAEALDVIGLVNVQFAVKDGVVFVLEANPRASRTVPFVAKATGVPVAMVAARVMLGSSLSELRSEGLLTEPSEGGHVSVKEAVLPFGRFPGTDTLLGPEMRSTGEVMGVGATFGIAFAKSQIAAGTRLPDSGTVFMSLADRDKAAGLELARAFCELGFEIAATSGTAAYLAARGVPVATVAAKVGEPGSPNAASLIVSRRGSAGREHAAGPGAPG